MSKKCDKQRCLYCEFGWNQYKAKNCPKFKPITTSPRPTRATNNSRMIDALAYMVDKGDGDSFHVAAMEEIRVLRSALKLNTDSLANEDKRG